MRCKYCGSESTEIRQVRREVRTDDDMEINAEVVIWTVDCNSCGSVSEYKSLTGLVKEYVDELVKLAESTPDQCPGPGCAIVYGWNYVHCHTCGGPPKYKENMFK